MIRHPPDAGLADTENCNSPSKAPLAEDCCSCAILAILCASILICGQAAWETHDVSQDSPDDSGQRFTSATHTIDEAQIKTFAVQFDPQPFHIDEKAVERMFFKGLAASGWHTAAITMRLNVESGPPIAGGIIGVGGELNWPAPTRPGDILHVESQVVEITPSRSRPDRGTIVLLSRTMNQRGEVVQIFKARLVVPRRVAS
jgi:acyl dehydratase